jgi:hypothetical protein
VKRRIGVFSTLVFTLAAGSLPQAQSNLFVGAWNSESYKDWPHEESII